ncbi:MAG TPA: hypothetical protein VGU71_00010 [Candidatus Dormibacteraeota bacterium]|nr:hypothetical protein [Candidatus Dormibacteraeota bacterium]
MFGATIEGDERIIRISLQQPAPSASGKPLAATTTQGNIQTGARVKGKPVTIGVTRAGPAFGGEP